MFEAWTNPELMQQWMVPPEGWTARTKNQLNIGGKFHHEMIVGQEPAYCGSYTPGEVLLHYGQYLEITPPEKLVFTWNSPSVSNTQVTVELKDLGDTTELWLTHELLLSEQDRQSHTQGWEGCLAKLERLLK